MTGSGAWAGVPASGSERPVWVEPGHPLAATATAGFGGTFAERDQQLVAGVLEGVSENTLNVLNCF